MHQSLQLMHTWFSEYAFAYVLVAAYKCICVFVCVHTWVFVSVSVFFCVSVHVHVYMCVCVCVLVCVCVHACVCVSNSRELIISGMIWCYNYIPCVIFKQVLWLFLLFSCCTLLFPSIKWMDVTLVKTTHHECLPNKTKVMWYWLQKE